MTTQGDAEPLKVHAPFFCTRSIGQNTPYPCANNTLTVSIMANTFLSANGTVITLTGKPYRHTLVGTYSTVILIKKISYPVPCMHSVCLPLELPKMTHSVRAHDRS